MYLTKVALVPLNVKGSQMYVEAIRFDETQRSPMYLPLSTQGYTFFSSHAHITLFPTCITKEVWES